MTSAIDWQEARRRLEAIARRIEQGSDPGPGERRRILRERALALAREEKKDAEDSGESIRVVEFLLASERYAVETVYVREVRPLGEFAPLPGTPPFVLGVLSVRGRIVSVIDIRRFFDLPEKGLTDLNRVLVLDDGNVEFGLLADGILGVRSVPLGSIQPSLPTLSGIRGEHLKGVTGERLVILDAARLLSDDRMAVRDSPRDG